MARAKRGTAIENTKGGHRGYTDEQLTVNDLFKEIKRQYVAMELLRVSGAHRTNAQNEFRRLAAKYFSPLVQGKAAKEGNRGEMIYGRDMLMKELDQIVSVLKLKYPRLQRADVSERLDRKAAEMWKWKRKYPRPAYEVKEAKPDRLYPLAVFKADSTWRTPEIEDTFYGLYQKIGSLVREGRNAKHLQREDTVDPSGTYALLKKMQYIPARVLFTSPALLSQAMSSTYCIKRRLTMKECWQIMNGTRSLPDCSRVPKDGKVSVDAKLWQTPLQRVASYASITVVDTALAARYKAGKIFNRDAYRVTTTMNHNVSGEKIIEVMEEYMKSGRVKNSLLCTGQEDDE